MLVWVAATALAYDLLGAEATPTGRSIAPAEHFVAGELRAAPVLSDPQAVGAVARETARELLEQYAEGTPLATTGALAEVGVGLRDVLDTLRLIARVAAEDEGADHQRLTDPEWLRTNLRALDWHPDLAGAAERGIALSAEQIRLTNYVVYESPACPERAPGCDTALYAVPDDEADGGPPGLRLQYTRMDVYGGVYEPGGASAGRARPLVWMSREHANQALMQGSVIALMPDGARRVFNVHQNNAIPYDPKQKDMNRQARFWYFREVDDILGVARIPLVPGAAVAGDVQDLGLGQLLGLTWTDRAGEHLRLVVLADTGGAFEPNLFQLDWLGGTFPSQQAWRQWAKTVPGRVHAQILVRR
ncbi:MAG: hypothetical protein KC621_01880 [Myxococcales bacterium]|nr:hypothetical protein [Myxococcales bacterium]